MTDETRKDQEQKDELTDKDLDRASGGRPSNANEVRPEESHEYNGTERSR